MSAAKDDSTNVVREADDSAQDAGRSATKAKRRGGAATEDRQGRSATEAGTARQHRVETRYSSAELAELDDVCGELGMTRSKVIRGAAGAVSRAFDRELARAARRRQADSQDLVRATKALERHANEYNEMASQIRRNGYFLMHVVRHQRATGQIDQDTADALVEQQAALLAWAEDRALADDRLAEVMSWVR